MIHFLEKHYSSWSALPKSLDFGHLVKVSEERVFQRVYLVVRQESSRRFSFIQWAVIRRFSLSLLLDFSSPIGGFTADRFSRSI